MPNTPRPNDCIGDIFDIQALRKKIDTELMKDDAKPTLFSHWITHGYYAGEWSGVHNNAEPFETPSTLRYMVIKTEDRIIGPDGDLQHSFAIAAPYTEDGLNANAGQLVCFSVGCYDPPGPGRVRLDPPFSPHVPYTVLDRRPDEAKKGAKVIWDRYQSLATAGKHRTEELIQNLVEMALLIGLPTGAESKLPDAIRRAREISTLNLEIASLR